MAIDLKEKSYRSMFENVAKQKQAEANTPPAPPSNEKQKQAQEEAFKSYSRSETTGEKKFSLGIVKSMRAALSAAGKGLSSVTKIPNVFKGKNNNKGKGR